jgi:hypothetical protein
VVVLYHNPEHERILTRSAQLKKIGETHQYAIYEAG